MTNPKNSLILARCVDTKPHNCNNNMKIGGWPYFDGISIFILNLVSILSYVQVSEQKVRGYPDDIVLFGRNITDCADVFRIRRDIKRFLRRYE